MKTVIVKFIHGEKVRFEKVLDVTEGATELIVQVAGVKWKGRLAAIAWWEVIA